MLRDVVQQELNDKDVQGLKHFKRLLPLLRRLRDSGCERDRAGNRRLYMDEYCELVILALLNPMINSLRTLRKTIGLDHVANTLGIRRFSLGSFSESPRVFEPQRLRAVIDELAKELRPLSKDPRLSELKDVLTLVDSTILAALTRLARAAVGAEARYNTSRDGLARYAWRLHTQFQSGHLRPASHRPHRGAHAGANREHNVLRARLEAERCYIGDGGYADRSLFAPNVVARGSSYVIRMREDSVFTVLEERELSQEAARDAGIVRDAIVTLGPPGAAALNHPVRIVVIQVKPHPRRTRRDAKKQSDVIVVATCLLDLPPELVTLIYSKRYTIELFFRFLKELLGMRHLLSERQEGIDIQVYCAVIICMLINLTTAKRPDKYTLLMVHWYQLGVASEQELIDHLNQPDNRGTKLRAEEDFGKNWAIEPRGRCEHTRPVVDAAAPSAFQAPSRHPNPGQSPALIQERQIYEIYSGKRPPGRTGLAFWTMAPPGTGADSTAVVYATAVLPAASTMSTSIV